MAEQALPKFSLKSIWRVDVKDTSSKDEKKALCVLAYDVMEAVQLSISALVGDSNYTGHLRVEKVEFVAWNILYDERDFQKS